jgi:hypothetical protein
VNTSYRTSVCLLALVFNLSANAAATDAAVQFHSAGGAQLANDDHLTSLHEIIALPSTTNLENIALARFSNVLRNIWRLGSNAESGASLQPLLNDALETESLGSFGSAPGDALSFILALHLEPARAQLWQDTFAKVFGNSGEKFVNQEFSGLRWSAGKTNSLWVIPAQDWLLVGCDADFTALEAEYLSQIKAHGRPAPALTDNWLEADLDSTQLGGWFRLLKPAHIRMTVATNDFELQIHARVLEAEDIPWKFAPWQIPRELMRNRTISFTAGQDVATFLKLSPPYDGLPGNPLTNQFYFWALDQMPLLNFMAWPVANASNVLKELSTVAPSALNPFLKTFNGSELVWRADQGKLILLNINLFAPVLQAEQSDGGQFLMLSSFPLSQSEPAPESILANIQGRTNLVYYDWELTGRRLRDWQMLSKMIANRARKQTRESFYKAGVEDTFIGALTRLEGETVTEITRVAPNELSITRKAPLGFTAIELVLMADWLCDAGSGPIFPKPSTPKKAPTPPPLRH